MGRVGQEVSDFLDDLAAHGAERHWDGPEEQAARRQQWLQDLGADLLQCQALAVRSALQRVRQAATQGAVLAFNAQAGREVDFDANDEEEEEEDEHPGGEGDAGPGQ